MKMRIVHAVWNGQLIAFAVCVPAPLEAADRGIQQGSPGVSLFTGRASSRNGENNPNHPNRR